MRRAFALLAAGRLGTRSMITHRLRPDEIDGYLKGVVQLEECPKVHLWGILQLAAAGGAVGR